MKLSAGSALLMAMTIGAILMIATTTSWYAACLLHDAACVRQQVFQHKQAAYGLLVWATTRAQARFDELCKAPEPILLYQGAWPCGDGKFCTGYAVSNQTATGIKICVILQKESKQASTATALLAYQTTDSKHIVIEQWGADDAVC